MMAVDPTFEATIDRTDMGLEPLILSGDSRGTGALAVSSWIEPPMQPRIHYAPESAWVHGAQPLGWAWQQSIQTFELFTKAIYEAQSREALTELRAAISRLSWSLTITVSDAPAETWQCDPGALTNMNGRSYTDLRYFRPQWVLSIPCHPVRSLSNEEP